MNTTMTFSMVDGTSMTFHNVIVERRTEWYVIFECDEKGRVLLIRRATGLYECPISL